jgi:hypothetical protein
MSFTGQTHFPIALLLFSTACDFASVTFKKFARGLRLVSFYGLAVAALASLGAVVSGIALTGGDLWGRGLAFADHVHGRSPDCCSVPNRENLVIASPISDLINRVKPRFSASPEEKTLWRRQP